MVRRYGKPDLTCPSHPNAGRADRLRRDTAASHGRLDRRIMAAEPFRDRAHFVGFLSAQQIFLHHVENLYHDPVLADWLPQLSGSSRLRAVNADAADLGAPPLRAVPRLQATSAEGLGWLYVAEGSRLGGAVLASSADRLGLNSAFGARHLAPPPEGLGAFWRSFRSGLDAAPVPAEEEDAVLAGALAAFDFVSDAMAESLTPA
ncbi:biliverdin-producing heme oxygenase [Hansschlegelia beijingensis]|uniref:biliverdin-producing heme oxygenase n=1 Tax=Hansschlegelia beijingensis TaxID=1133344 RepID=UPI00387F274D